MLKKPQKAKRLISTENTTETYKSLFTYVFSNMNLQAHRKMTTHADGLIKVDSLR